MPILTHDPTVGQLYADTPQRIATSACKALINADCYNLGIIRKRPGFEELSLAITTGGLVKFDELHTVAYLGDELVLFAENQVWSYRDDLDQWELRGAWTQNNAEALTLHDTYPDQSQVGVAYAGDYRLTIWRDEETTTQHYYGTTYREGLPPQYVGASRGTAFGAPGDLKATIYQGAGDVSVVALVDSADQLTVQGISPTGGFLGLPLVIATVSVVGSDHAIYDLHARGDEFYIAFVDSGGTFTLASFSVISTGIDPFSFVTIFSGALGVNHIALTVGQLSDGRAFVGWIDNVSPSLYRFAWITPGVGVTHTASATPPDAQTCLGITCEVLDSDNVRCAVDYETVSVLGAVSTYKVNVRSQTPSSTTSASLLELPAARIIGKPWNAGLSIWFPLQLLSGATQGLVVDSEDGEAIAEFAHNGAIGFDGDLGTALAQPYAAPAYDSTTRTVEFPHIVRVLQVDPDEDREFLPFGARIPAMIQLSERTACMFPQQFNDALHWPAPGYLRSYSAGEAYEAGFHGGAPRFLALTATAGVALTAGTYQYAATWTATDANGKVFRSAPTFSDSITVAGPNLAVLVRLYSLSLTERDRVNVEVWRTLSGQTGPYFLVTSQSLPTDAISATAVVSITDQTSDAVAVTRPQLNQQPVGTQLPNNSTPVANWCSVAGDRLWCRDLDVPGRVRASKFKVDGIGTEMSPYILVDQPEDAKGDVSRGLAQQDGVFFLVGARTVSVYQGDGPDNTGAGGSFSPASLIPAAEGHLLDGGVVVTPVGILYVTDEGLGSLGRNQGILDAVPAITSAYRNQGYQIGQIHFERDRSELWLIDPQDDPEPNPRPSLPDPTTLVYSESTNRWSAMATELRSRSIAGNAAGGLVVIRAAGAIWRRNLSIATDAGAAVPLRIRTGWLQVGDLASATAQWETIVLTANYLSSHMLSISIRADYSETVRVTYSVDMTATPPPQLQYQVQLDSIDLNSNAIDIEISDDGDGFAWELVQISASYRTASSTNNLIVLPPENRFGVETRTAPV